MALLPPRTVRCHDDDDDDAERPEGSTGTPAEDETRLDAHVEVALDDPSEDAKSFVPVVKVKGTRPNAKNDLSWAAQDAFAALTARKVNKARTRVMISTQNLSWLRTMMITVNTAFCWT